MRGWKNWLFPLLTCLIVAGLAFLPLWLSIQGDEGRTGIVHSEELSEDSNFPAKAPALPGRIWLLAQRDSLPDGLTIMEQILEDEALEEAAVQAKQGLSALEAAGIFPEGWADSFQNFSGSLIYLRDQTDLSSAAFFEMSAFEKSAYDKGTDDYIWMYLDRESGKILSLTATSDLFLEFPGGDAPEIGRTFLDSLGVSCTEADGFQDARYAAIFLLPDSQALCVVRREARLLSIHLEVDWELLDKLLQDGRITGSAVQSALGYDG